MKEKTYFEILEEMEQDKLKKFDPQTALRDLCARVVKRLQDEGPYFCILPKRRANSSRDFTRNCRPDRSEYSDVKELDRYNEK